MAGTKISALTAAAALGGTEEIPGVQSAANVKITPAQIKTFTSASPTLVTPEVGVATGTSLALSSTGKGVTVPNAASALVPQLSLSGFNTGVGMDGNDKVYIVSNNVVVARAVAGATPAFGFASGLSLGWTSTTATGTPDANASRVSAGVVGIGTGAAGSVAGSLQLTNLIGSGYLKSGSYTVGTVPSASSSGAGSIIYVSNEAGGAAPAFSDGTNWRRYSDRAIIS